MDQKLTVINTTWLFFIVTLPFATSVVSQHFGDPAAIFLYCLNVFVISVCQNFIRDYADVKTDFIDRKDLTKMEQRKIRLVLNLDMINGLIAIVLSFFYPRIAFFLLFFKLSILVFTPFFNKRLKKEKIPLEDDTIE